MSVIIKCQHSVPIYFSVVLQAALDYAKIEYHCKTADKAKRKQDKNVCRICEVVHVIWYTFYMTKLNW